MPIKQASPSFKSLYLVKEGSTLSSTGEGKIKITTATFLKVKKKKKATKHTSG